MKKILLTFTLILPFFLYSQHGKVMDNLSMDSKILNGKRKYAVYFPPDYAASDRSYPVLYLLHGGGDDQTGWVQFGEVLNITDNAIRDGIATPMIIVMPDANTGTRGYFNNPDNSWRYEDFFFDEFMPYVEKTYRIKTEKRFRAVAGLSMGGGGSFAFALHRPDLFSSACPLSASTGALTLEELSARFTQMKTASTPEQSATYFKKYSVPEFIKNAPDSTLKAVKWYIDCGDDDFLFEGNSLVHIALRKRNIPHEFRIRNGSHSWTYWREALPEVLRFVSNTFHQN